MVRPWRVGSVAGGVSLIGFGALLLAISYGGVTWGAAKYLWPIVVIAFGAEIVTYSLIVRGQRTRVSVLGVILVGLVLLASIAGYTVSKVSAALGFSAGGGGLFTMSQLATTLVPVRGTVPLSQSVQKLDIQVPNADVTVTAGTAPTATYRGELAVPGSNQAQAEGNLKTDWQVRVQGNTLEMIMNRPQAHTFWSLFKNNFGNSKGSLTVQIPPQLMAQIRTVNGSITVNGTTQGVVAETVNGGVTVQSVTGRVVENVVNGTLSASQITGDVQLHAVNGSINVDQVSGQLNIDDVNGGIQVNSAVGGDWKVSTVNGGITVAVPGGTNATMSAKSIRGISGSIPWQANGDNHHLSAVLGSGRYSVNLSTTNGAILVNQGS